MINKTEKIRSLIEEAREFKEIARKSTRELEYYQSAAQRFREAAAISEELAQAEVDVDSKIQHEVFSAYYSYEQHYCLGAYFYERRETQTAKTHFGECAEQITKAIRRIESLPPTLSPEVDQHLTCLLPNYRYRQQATEIELLANDARAAWDQDHLMDALDKYKAMAKRQKRILKYLDEVNIDPIFERIEKGNYVGMMANASSTLARIMLKEASKNDENERFSLPNYTFVQLLRYTFEAYQLGLLAFKQNPEWQQFREMAQQCLYNIQEALKLNESAWSQLYLEFEHEPEFLKIMKTTDINKFKDAEARRHIRESKLLKLWVMGSFWIFAFSFISAVVIYIWSSQSDWWRFLLAIAAIEGLLVLLGAFILRSLGDLSEANFLKLIGYAFKYQFKFFRLSKPDESRPDSSNN